MIRWIVEPQLGTAAFHDVAADSRDVLDVRYLVDGPGNAPGSIETLIARGLEVLQDGKPLIVACDFGVSRSNSIAAGILARWKGQSYDDAVQTVMAQTCERNIKLSIIETIRAVLEPSAEASGNTGAILVTGGSGFVGRNLLAHLQADAQSAPVLAPTRAELDLTAGAAPIAAYLRSHNIRQIVHLAFPRVYTNIPAMGESLTILRTLIDACITQNVTLTLISGAVVFSGYKTQNLLADLHLPPRAVHVYGETKLLEETLVRQNIENSGLSARIVRLAPVYGPGALRPRFIRHFHEAIRAGQTIHVHRYLNGPAKLELLYINDAVAALVEIVRRDLQGQFHIGTGVSYAPLEVAEEIARLIGHPLQHTQRDLDEHVSNVLLGARSTAGALDWAPRTSLTEGLWHTLAL